MAAVVKLPAARSAHQTPIFLPSLVTKSQKSAPEASEHHQPVASTSSATPAPAEAEPSADAPAPSPSKSPRPRPKKRKLSSTPIAVNGRLQDSDATDNIFVCTVEGCEKSYNRASRLEEHLRSHTDERPFVCHQCGSSYRRETHLSGHMRTHRPESERPLACTVDTCSKRFWTKQHVARHVAISHNREKEHQCTECDEAFAKAFQLRAHVAAAHRPEGTLPNICEHPGCSKSFAAPSQLRAHAKCHAQKTYACAHASCINKAEGAPVFNTWSALQAHIKSDHPPTCPHASCRGQRFSTTSHLRRHLSTVHQEAEEIPEGEQLALRFRRKRYSRAKKQPQQSEVQTEQQASSHGHPQQQNDEPDGQHDEDEEDEEEEETEEEATQIEDDDDDALDSDCDLPWHCIETNCGKSFATAAAFHAHVLHDHASQPSRKTLACDFPACTFTARKQHALDRHLSSVHPGRSRPSATFVQKDFHQVSGTSALDMLTGRNYGQAKGGPPAAAADDEQEEEEDEEDGGGEPAAKKRRRTLPMRFACPIQVHLLEEEACEQRFWRAYDVQRHLKRNHEVDLTRTEVENLLEA